MKIKYPCGCNYEFSMRETGVDYVEDDGYDFELCCDHLKKVDEHIKRTEIFWDRINRQEEPYYTKWMDNIP